MIIKQIKIKNYRTLENVEVFFNGYYTAISGKNNAGKSNIIRAIRGTLNQGMRLRILGGSYFGIEGFDWNDDITSWKKETKEDISLKMTIEIHKNRDAAIYRFLTDLIFKDVKNFEISETETLEINYTKKPNNTSEYKLYLGSNEVEGDYQKREVLKRLRSTECLIFHNSTNRGFGPFDESMDRVSNFISAHDSAAINKKKRGINKANTKVA